MTGPEFDRSFDGPPRKPEALITHREMDPAAASRKLTEQLGQRKPRPPEQPAAGKVVGWFHGRMEFGPRALVARSIIGDARNPQMQSTMNLRIKFRESFRPFAPCVLREDVSEYFELDHESPYMLLVADVRPELRHTLTPDQIRLMKDPDLRKRVNVPRSTLPAITHVDMSARIQTVDEQRHGRFHRLMKEYKRQTGCGVIINNSFNIRGEPIF